jgi:beta-lactamase superfamily II metal-dependent hydrolase
MRVKKEKLIKEDREVVEPLDGKSIRIRMYRVGFGDCFLLSVPTARGQNAERDEHILVDCGVHSRGDIGTMEEIVTNISQVTNKKLAVVIATHAHQDHISGFAEFGDMFSTFKVKEVWLPWTWDEKNEKALKIQKMHAALIAQLVQHFPAQGMDVNQEALCSRKFESERQQACDRVARIWIWRCKGSLLEGWRCIRSREDFYTGPLCTHPRSS